MIRLIAIAAFALAVATPAQAMSPAPLHQSDGMITQVAYGCGAGRTRVRGVCVARTTKRQVRRCAVWGAGHVCRRWYWVAATSSRAGSIEIIPSAIQRPSSLRIVGV
jgi:hypothetical protein